MFVFFKFLAFPHTWCCGLPHGHIAPIYNHQFSITSWFFRKRELKWFFQDVGKALPFQHEVLNLLLDRDIVGTTNKNARSISDYMQNLIYIPVPELKFPMFFWSGAVWKDLVPFYHAGLQVSWRNLPLKKTEECCWGKKRLLGFDRIIDHL